MQHIIIRYTIKGKQTILEEYTLYPNSELRNANRIKNYRSKYPKDIITVWKLERIFIPLKRQDGSPNE